MADQLLDLTDLADDVCDRTVEVAAGDRVTVRLTEIPSAGYVWQVSFDADDLDVSAGPSTSEQDLASDDVVVGGASVRVFAITRREAGPAAVTFSYLRPWEGPDAALRTVRLTITAV